MTGRRRRRDVSSDWPEDFTERKRLAAQYGVAAAQNALAFLEQARILAEADVLDDVDDEDEEVDEDEEWQKSEEDDELDDEETAWDGRAEVYSGGHAQARAFALTVFATEEVAKAYAASLVLSLHDDDDPSAWEGFWGIIGEHRNKLQGALALEQVLPRLTGKQDDLSRSLQDVANEDVFTQRNRAIYVDVKDGATLTPNEFAEDPDVERLRESLAKSMVTWAIILEGSLEKQLGELAEGESPSD